jgi:hypothetical protein
VETWEVGHSFLVHLESKLDLPTPEFPSKMHLTLMSGFSSAAIQFPSNGQFLEFDEIEKIKKLGF